MFQVRATGSGPLVYQWYKVGIAVPGGQGDLLVLGPLEREAEGAYSVLVFNGVGEVRSEAAPLAVRRPPRFVVPPEEVPAEGRADPCLSAEVDGFPPPEFQWFREGRPMPGATRSRLVLSAAEARREGRFHLTASNALGGIESPAIIFGPRSVPAIIRRDVQNLVALPGTPVRFGVEVDPAYSPSFQWRKDGVNLPGETAAFLDIPSAAPGHEGGYSVRISLPDRPVVLSRTASLRLVDRILRVTSTADSGPNTLRAAVTLANTQGGTSGIFIEGNPPPADADGRIVIPARILDLQSALPPLLRDMVIEGPGDGEVVLQCAGGFRPFFVVSGRIDLADLTIYGGFAKGGDSWGGGGGAGMGGALFVDGGEVRLERVTFKPGSWGELRE